MRWMALLVALGAIGCGSDYNVEFRSLTVPPKTVSLDDDQVQIPASIAVAVEVTPYEDGEEMGEDVFVELVSQNHGVIGVDVALEEREFVLYGVEPGSTDIDLYFDDDFVGSINAVITEQKDEL